MTIRHLFDSTVRVWRFTMTYNELKQEKRTFVALAAPTRTNCKVNRPRARVGAVAGGQAPVGERVIYMDTGADVQVRDVLQLTTGPDAPALLEVDDVPTTPRGHHMEISCRLWHGTLPAEGS